MEEIRKYVYWRVILYPSQAGMMPCLVLILMNICKMNIAILTVVKINDSIPFTNITRTVSR